MSDLKQRVERALRTDGTHCVEEHSGQYESCSDCEREKEALIKDLAEREEKLVEALNEADKIIARTIGLSSEWPSATQYIDCRKKIATALK